MRRRGSLAAAACVAVVAAAPARGDRLDRGSVSLKVEQELGLARVQGGLDARAEDFRAVGLLRNPRRATYELVSELIAHSGEQVQSTLPVTIGGCLSIPSASVTRRGHTVTATWSPPGAEATAVRVQRRHGVDWVTVRSTRTSVSGHADRCRRCPARRPSRPARPGSQDV